MDEDVMSRQASAKGVPGAGGSLQAGSGSASGAAAGFYRRFVEPLLRTDGGVDAEQLSRLTLMGLAQGSLRRDWPLVEGALAGLGAELQRRNPRLQQTIFGCRFANPVGLAAGFDKNGVAAAIWHCFGFGFAELGTVTAQPQQGNPRPRLFRLAAERAALNRMGFNNLGAMAVRRILERQALPPSGQRPAVLGINLGKSREVSLELAPDDYAIALELLAPLGDYAVINVSSPNTPGLRELQQETQLRRLVERLRRLPGCPPLLVKIAPDLEDDAIDAIARLAYQEGLAGVIAVNTSQDRLGLADRILGATGRPLAQESGGLSGRPLRHRALAVLRRLRAMAGPSLPLIGVGGIDSAESAWERISAGASLVQVYTGWIYEGPQLVPNVLDGLITQLDRHGLATIGEAVGSGLPWR